MAWFSPMPPVRTGIAGRSAELVTALRRRGYQVDVFVDTRPGAAAAVAAPGTLLDPHDRCDPRDRCSPDPRDRCSAYDFVWTHAQHPYDLLVYQFGNSSHHDYMWAYALRYPGLVVLHDTRLHHARAAALLREKRVADYRAEFAWNHPDISPDLAELAVAGFDSALYYDWPMVRALVATSRLTAVHGEGAAEELRSHLTTSPPHHLTNCVVPIRLGEGEELTPARGLEARARVRARYGIPDEAIVFGVFGGLTPEKRIPQILRALAATIPHAPDVRLLLAGAPAAHYDVTADVRACGLDDRVTVTGYLDVDADVTDHLAACDVSLNLRWPTARETSGPWLRALAAGRATVITDLVHLTGFASLDPRTWTVNEAGGQRTENRGQRPEARNSTRGGSDLSPLTSDLSAPICVSLDILDEEHSLRLAMRRLAADAELRARLGDAGHAWWRQEHAVEVMVDDYVRVIAETRRRPLPARTDLPAHLTDAGDRRLAALSGAFGVDSALRRDGLLR